MVIRRIGVFSAGKVSAVLYALIGLLIGAFMSIIALLGGSSGQGGMIGMVMGVGAIVILPIVYGLIGFIGGMIGALIYNLASSLVGGVTLEVE